MNKYDEFFDFRMANINDVDTIMQFIKEEWNANHILANNKDFFIWMYGHRNSDNIDFVLMLDKSNTIKGLNGFVSYSDDPEKLYVSSAITKVSNSVTVPMVGVELIRRFHALTNAKAYYSYGTNPKTMAPIGKRIFNFDVGYMDHFYRLNSTKAVFNVAKILSKKIISFVNTDWKLEEIKNKQSLNEYNFDIVYEHQAFKSKTFIVKRYFNHPVYTYKKYLVRNSENKAIGILFGREIIVNQTRILRFVDYVGDLSGLKNIGAAINELILQNEYEYADFYEKGVPEEYMTAMGFIKNDGENIVPNYFEPFVQENISLMYQRSDPNIVIFKADGDQDRPNFINRE